MSTESLEVLFPPPEQVRGYDAPTRRALSLLKMHLDDFLEEVGPMAIKGEMEALQQRPGKERTDAEHEALGSLSACMGILQRLDQTLEEFLTGKKPKTYSLGCNNQELVDFTARTALALLARIRVSTQQADFNPAVHDVGATIAMLCYDAAEKIGQSPMVDIPYGTHEIMDMQRPWKKLFHHEQIARLDDTRTVPDYRPQLEDVISVAHHMVENLQPGLLDEASLVIYRRLQEISEGKLPPENPGSDKNALMLDAATYEHVPLMNTLREMGLIHQLDELFTDNDRVNISIQNNQNHYVVHRSMTQYVSMKEYFRKHHDLRGQAAQVVAAMKAHGKLGGGESAEDVTDTVVQDLLKAFPPFLDGLYALQRAEGAKEKPDEALLETLGRTEKITYTLMGDALDGAVAVQKEDVEALHMLWSEPVLPSALHDMAKESGLSEALKPLFSPLRASSIAAQESNWERIAERFNAALGLAGGQIPGSQLPSGTRISDSRMHPERAQTLGVSASGRK